MSQVIQTELSDYVVKELGKLSAQTKKTKAYHINKAIQMYINNYTDFDTALDRLQNLNDEVISTKQMNELLDL